MSTGIRSILCIILGVSGSLAPRSANANPYRDSYTVVHPAHSYLKESPRIVQKGPLYEESSGLVLLINNNSRRFWTVCLNNDTRYVDLSKKVIKY